MGYRGDVRDIRDNAIFGENSVSLKPPAEKADYDGPLITPSTRASRVCI